jgi:hypothetical protein
VLYSREKNSRRDKEENAASGKMVQSEIRKNSDSLKPQLSEISKQYLKQLPEEKETLVRQSKQELDDIFKAKTIGLVGLCNIGNTCFMYISPYVGTPSCSACLTYLNSMIISCKTCTLVSSTPAEEWRPHTAGLCS